MMDYYGPSATTTYVSYYTTSGTFTEPTYIYYQSDDGEVCTIAYDYSNLHKKKKEDKLNKDIHNLIRDLMI